VPVGYYTGAVQLSIPITEVTDGSLRVPVSLSYASTTNKVGEVASWVGLGWSLQAGGAVTRVVRGKPDEGGNGVIVNYLSLIQNVTYQQLLAASGPVTPLTYWNEMVRGCMDAEPDLFYFNMPGGGSGSFMFNWDGQLVVDASSPVTVEPVFSGTAPRTGQITAWRITTADGTRYTFAASESTTQWARGATAINCAKPTAVTTTWHLSTIVDANREHQINFEYEGYRISYGYRAIESIKIATIPGGDCGSEDRTGSVSKLEYAAARIRRITTTSGVQQVDFVPGALRTDTLGLTGQYNRNLRSLRRIVVSNAASSPVKSYEFDYYATNPTGRLTLRQLRTCGSDTLYCEPPHQFRYSPVALPADVRSFAQDHWGFYNGALSNTTMLPTTEVLMLTGNSNPQSTVLYPGADRAPNAAMAAAGLLTRVTYPGGGFSEFSYESNKYGYVQSRKLRDDTPQYTTTNITKIATASCDGGAPSDACSTGTTNFTISPDLTGGSSLKRVTVTCGGYTATGIGARRSYVRILDATGNVVFTPTPAYFGTGIYINPATAPTNSIQLPAGDYQLVAYACDAIERPADNPDTGAHGCSFAEIRVAYDQYTATSTPILNRLSGGARVKEIRDYAKESDQMPTVRRFKYTDFSDSTQSSGCIYAQPRYSYSTEETVQQCSYIYIVAQNVTVLGSTQGSHIGYRQVEVQSIDQNGQSNGSTRYEFTSPAEYPDSYATKPPFTPPASQSHMTGLLARQADYTRSPSGLQLIRQSTNKYRDFSQYVNGVVATFQGAPAFQNLPDFYTIVPYSSFLGHAQKVQTSEVSYGPDPTAPPAATYTNNQYDEAGRRLLTTTSTVPKRMRTHTRYYYPEDYSQPATWQQAMAATYRISTPVETVTQRVRLDSPDTTAQVVNSFYATYRDASSKLRLVAQAQLNAAAPLKNSDYQYSVTTPNGQPDARLLPKMTVDGYDRWGNIVQLRRVGAPSITRLWGYNGTYLLAEATNCTYAQLAYTSFEPGATGRWRYDSLGTHRVAGGFTGRWAYRLDGLAPVSRDQLPVGDYELTAWVQSPTAPVLTLTAGQVLSAWQATATAPGGWTQFRARLRFTAMGRVSLDAPTAKLLDELRLSPVGAQPTTYTHDPLVGMTSQTDPVGRTTTYKYDTLGRLIRTRDEQGRILSQQQYNYAKP